MGAIINGHPYDYGNIEIRVDEDIFGDISEITYAHRLEPGVLRGTSPMPLGFTVGQYEVTNASFTIYKETHLKLIRKLVAKNKGRGYMQGVFLIHVSYTPIPGDDNETVLDVLEGCRIMSDEDSHQSGNNALVVKCELKVFRLQRNGIAAVGGQGLDNRTSLLPTG